MWTGEQSCLYRDSNSDPSVVQNLANCCTDCAMPAQKNPQLLYNRSTFIVVSIFTKSVLPRILEPRSCGGCSWNLGTYFIYMSRCRVCMLLLTNSISFAYLVSRKYIWGFIIIRCKRRLLRRLRLQARRLRVRFWMRSLNFLNLHNPSSSTMALGQAVCNRDEYQ
jgi:hypothetical protein